MSTDLLLILGAVLLAAAGGEAFLKSILGAAIHLRIPKAIAATTLAAFATSSPELTVSTVAALSGSPEIGLGDALGSNVVNIALIFGIALLFGAMNISRKEFGREYVLALLVPAATLLLVADGHLVRWEGALLLAAFVLWLGALLQVAKSRRCQASDVAEENESLPGAWRCLLFGVFGLAALIAAGRLFVLGATGVASALGVDGYVIGAIVIAIGTSLPELVTVILSRLRGHDDVGVGALIGSNLFNGLAIVGVAASLHPATVPLAEIVVTLGFGVAALLLLLPNRSGVVSRQRGFLLLGLYGGFVVTTLMLAR